MSDPLLTSARRQSFQFTGINFLSIAAYSPFRSLPHGRGMLHEFRLPQTTPCTLKLEPRASYHFCGLSNYLFGSMIFGLFCQRHFILLCAAAWLWLWPDFEHRMSQRSHKKCKQIIRERISTRLTSFGVQINNKTEHRNLKPQQSSQNCVLLSGEWARKETKCR